MRRLNLSILLIILLAAAGCELPNGISKAQATQTAFSIQIAAAETINAAQAAVTQTVAALGIEITATVEALAAAATQTAGSVQATANAQAAEATQAIQAAEATMASQNLAATAAALDARATSISQTATAQAYQFPEPPPPPPPFITPNGTGIRLSFPSGATSLNVGGQIGRGQVIDYILRALQGQTMLTSVYSPNNNVLLGIIGQSDGIPLIRTAADATTFTGVLPGTQDYRISLFSPNQNTNYTLQVIIPARIQFAPGAVSETIEGYLNGGEVNYYLAGARAGQEMSVTIVSPANDIFLTIYGMQDGTPLVRSMMAQTSWAGVLPATQDYMIQAVSTGAASNYLLQTIIR